MTRLSELTNVDRFREAIATGLVDARFDEVTRDDAHPLMVCCYSTRCQLEGLWVSDTTMLARGLVLRLPHPMEAPEDLGDADVVARGIRKFFTVEAAREDWGHVELVDDDEGVVADVSMDIDPDAPSSVSNKVDGALNIAFPYGTTYRICTKGSFSSDEARIGGRLLRDKGGRDRGAELRGLMDAESATEVMTPLFEVVTPEAHHVIDYGGFEDVVFLGLVHIPTGRWIPAANLASDPLTAATSLADIPGRCGFRTPEPMPYASLGEALTAPEIDNHEGMVVTSETSRGQVMYKVKYPTFLRMQAVRHLSRFGVRALESAIPTDELFHGDAHRVVAGNVIGTMRSSTAWTRDMAEMVADQLDEAYVWPARRLYGTVTNEACAVRELGLDVTSREGRKAYALGLREHVRDGLVSAEDQAALFLVPAYMGEGIPSSGFDAAMRALVDRRFGR